MAFVIDKFLSDPRTSVPLLSTALVGSFFTYQTAHWVWVATLPSSSPTTTISEQEIVRSRTRRATHHHYSYINVGGQRYLCRGSTAPRGVQVVYDPQTPSRCREPQHLWSMQPGEGLTILPSGLVLGVMLLALVKGIQDVTLDEFRLRK